MLIFHCIYFYFVTQWSLPRVRWQKSQVDTCQHRLAVTCYLGSYTCTYHVSAFGLEGVGAAGVEERVVVALEETDVVETLGL